MVAFTPVLQADLSGTAFGAAPTWTDLTRFARLKVSPAQITAWRQDQLSDIAPTSMTIVLDNALLPGDPTAPNAGRFTPDLSTSPWYPWISPGARVRFGVTVSATTYWLCDGYADSWDAGYEDGEFETCTLQVTDILAQFGTANPLRSIYLEEALSVDHAVALWPLTEANGSTSAGSITTTTQPTLTPVQAPAGGGDYAFGAAGGIPAGDSSMLTLNASLTTDPSNDLLGYYLTTPFVADFSVTGFTVEAWVVINPTLATALSRHLISGFSPVPIVNFTDRIGVEASMAVVWNSSAIGLGWLAEAHGAMTGINVSAPNINDGQLHHLVATYKVSTDDLELYLDGVSVGSLSPAASLGLTPVVKPQTLTVGGRPPNAQNGYGIIPPFRGTIQHVAVYPSVLTPARVTAHYTAGKTAFAGEASDTHIARLLSYRTNLGATLDAGQGTVGAHLTSGVTLQQALLDTAKAEGGVLYIDANGGKVDLLNRARLRNPAVATTLDITAQQTGSDLRFRKDRQQMVNDSTITRSGGAARRVIDATSQASDGVRAKSDTLIVATDQDALNAAGMLVANGKTPRTRSPQLSVDLLNEPTAGVVTAALSLAPLKRVSLINPPTSAAATDVLVQGVTWTVGVDVFTAEFYTSPLPRPTLRFDATADAFTKLDAGNVFAW